MARTWLAPAKEDPRRRVHLLELDLRWLETGLCVPGEGADCLGPEQLRPDKGEPALAVLPLGAFGGGRALLADGRPVRGAGGPGRYLVLKPWRPGGTALPRLERAPASSVGSVSIQQAAGNPAGERGGHAPPVRSAICPLRERLLYATGLGVTAGQLRAALQHAGCAEVLQLGRVPPLVLPLKASLTTILGPLLPPSAQVPSLIFRRSRARFATRIFTHTRVQPHWIWNQLQPERTRSSALRQANRAIKALGLKPIKKLRALCRKPYDRHPELVKLRWVDPLTGRPTCPGDRWGKRRVKVKR